jgi:hypothetical protein
MSSLATKLNHDFVATSVWFSEDMLHVALDDGRETDEDLSVEGIVLGIPARF